MYRTEQEGSVVLQLQLPRRLKHEHSSHLQIDSFALGLFNVNILLQT